MKNGVGDKMKPLNKYETVKEGNKIIQGKKNKISFKDYYLSILFLILTSVFSFITIYYQWTLFFSSLFV